MTSENKSGFLRRIVDRVRGGRKADFSVLSTIIAFLALIISGLSYWVTHRSLKLAEDQFQYAIGDRIYVDGEWDSASLILDMLDTAHGNPDFDNGRLYGGLLAFVKFKLANASQHPITIDYLNTFYITGHGSASIPGGNRLFRRNTLAPISLPITLQPSEQITATKLVPLPLSKHVCNALSSLPQRSMLSVEAVTSALLSYNREHENVFGISKDDTSGLAKWISMRVTDPSHVPELLITIGEGQWTVRRGDRQLEVAVRLSSGMVIYDTLDYLDLNRTLIE